jgi:hypothetical protein
MEFIVDRVLSERGKDASQKYISRLRPGWSDVTETDSLPVEPFLAVYCVVRVFTRMLR